MDKSLLLRMLCGISLATINALAERENGICSVKYNGVEGYNELYKIRKSIIDQHISLKLKEKNYSLKPNSLLGMISENMITTNAYNQAKLAIDTTDTNLIDKLADLIEADLLLTKNEVLPVVNQTVLEIENEIAGMITPNMQVDFNLVYRDVSNLLKVLVETENSVNNNTNIGGLNFSFPAVDDIAKIKEYASIDNPIIQVEVDRIFNGESDAYWINLFNGVFGNLRASNQMIASLRDSKILNANKTIVLYLIARKFTKYIPFQLEGNKEDIIYNIRIFKEYLNDMIIATNELVVALDVSETLIQYNKDKTIVVNKTMMAANEGLDADVVIAAAMDNLNSLKDILANRDMLKEKYNKTNELFIASENNKLADTYRRLIMSKLDTMLSEDEEYSKVRVEIANKVYDKSIDELRMLKKIISKVLVSTKYKHTNVEFILDKMKDHARASSSENLDFNAISEYIALEMVCIYLINNHIVIEG